MPWLFEEVYAAAGEKMSDHVTLRQLQPGRFVLGVIAVMTQLLLLVVPPMPPQPNHDLDAAARRQRRSAVQFLAEIAPQR